MNQRFLPDLLAAHRRGENGAFAALVERMQGPLLRYLRFLPGALGEVEDIAQDTFLKLARTPPLLPDEDEGADSRLAEAHLWSWLFQVGRNSAMERLRSAARRRQREQRAAPPERVTGGQDAVDGRDLCRAVERSLGSLPDDQREVLALRLLAERTYQEIADITGRPAGTVAWLISEGMKALSRALAPALGDRAELPAELRVLRGGMR